MEQKNGATLKCTNCKDVFDELLVYVHHIENCKIGEIGPSKSSKGKMKRARKAVEKAGKSNVATESSEGKCVAKESSSAAQTDPKEVGENLRCSFCGKHFRHKSFLDRHVTAFHDAGVKPLFRCDHCDVLYGQKSFLDEHMQRAHEHPDAVMCRICGCRFPSTNALDKHIGAVHGQDKAFKCDLCEITFSHASDLISHMKKHPLSFCSYPCTKQFALQEDLDRHMRTFHSNIVSTLKCDFCSSRFSHESYLIQHVETDHKKRLGIGCIPCNKQFELKHDYDKHVAAVHQKNETFKCVTCDERFAHSWDYVSHIKAKHDNVEVVLVTGDQRVTYVANPHTNASL